MSATAPARRTCPSWGVAALLLVVAVAVAYANSLRAPFVYDDTKAIADNITIRNLWPLSEVLRPQTEAGLTVSGRPILNLSFALSYALSGSAPWGHHVFNIMIHTSSALLLFGLVRRTIERINLTPSRSRLPANPVALAAAAGWALHPLQTQAVTYTVQRAESLMGFFYLLTLYAFVRATENSTTDRPSNPQQQHWRTLGVGACVLGMGTKEVMATAPLLVFLYDRTFVTGTFGAAWRARKGFYLALAATWLVLAALVISTGGNRGGTVGPGVGVPWWAYGLTQFQAIVRYLALSAWPHPLVFEYGTFWVRDAADAAPYAAIVVPLLVVTIAALWRWPAMGFCGAWFFLILAPTSLTPGTIQMIVEHRMYLPLAAVVTVIVVAAWCHLGRIMPWIAGTVALAFAVATLQRNHDYRNHLALWSDTVAKRPLNPRAHDGLAEAFAETDRLEQAIVHREEAIRLLPTDSKYHYNLALNLADAGQLDRAIRHYRTSLHLAPNESRTHNNLAILLTRTGETDLALRHYAEALRLKPDDPQYHYNFGIAMMRANRTNEAATHFQSTLRSRPEDADAHFNLATALMGLNRQDEALEHYAEALRLRSGDTEFRITFGGALLLANRPQDALTQYNAVLVATPEAPAALFGAGNALAALRRYDEAITQYQALLRVMPTHANTDFKLANALLETNQLAAALEHYEVALRAAPEDAEAHHNFGIAYARLERWPEAQREFETALSLKPDYPEARRHLDQVRNLPGR